MIKKPKKKRRSRGFTFVEVLVSVALLAFVIMGVVTMTTMHVKSNFYTVQHTKAVQLAETAIEELLRLDFNQLSAGETTEDFGDIDGYAYYTRTVRVAFMDVDNANLTAEVNWMFRAKKEDLPPITLTVRRTRE